MTEIRRLAPERAKVQGPADGSHGQRRSADLIDIATRRAPRPVALSDAGGAWYHQKAIADERAGTHHAA